MSCSTGRSRQSHEPRTLPSDRGVYHAALEREPGERAAFLAEADPELRGKVEDLLTQDGASQGVLDAKHLAAFVADDANEEKLLTHLMFLLNFTD